MIDHVTLNVRDLEACKAFYEQALKPIGYELLLDFVEGCGYGAEGKPDFFLAQRGEPCASRTSERRRRSTRRYSLRSATSSRGRTARNSSPNGAISRLPRTARRSVRTSTLHSRRKTAMRSTHSTEPPLRPATATTGHPASDRSTTRAITAPLSS